MKFSDKAKDILREMIIKHWKLNGHNLTGSFIDSISFKENENQLEVYANGYGIVLNKGVSASNIPYSGRSGSGGNSKYITGLKNYAQKRMGISDEREALSVAFAIATKHSKEGIKGSGFLDDAFDETVDKLESEIVNNINKDINKWL